jgi:hypothetical protein
VAAWEKDIDRGRSHDVLNGVVPATELDEGLPMADAADAAAPVPSPAAGR